MITSSAATKGAPRVKKINASDSSDTIMYSNACTALDRVITMAVAMTATAAAI